MGMKGFLAGVTIGVIGGFLLSDYYQVRLPEPVTSVSEPTIPRGNLAVGVDANSLFRNYVDHFMEFRKLNVPELAVLLGQYGCIRENTTEGLEMVIGGDEFARIYGILTNTDKPTTIVNRFYVRRGKKDFLKIDVDRGTYPVTGTPAKVTFEGDVSALVYRNNDTMFVDLTDSTTVVYGMRAEKLKLYKSKDHIFGEIKGTKDGKPKKLTHRLTGNSWVSSAKTLFSIITD